ncbi:MAG: hypothetical protein LC648_10320 [Novosphingobium sp.]|nr:hypothetical protein [Novosphingobium sp.]
MSARQARHDPVPLLEWVTAGLGALVALALVGVIGWSALNERPDELPRLSVEAGPLEPAGPRRAVRFTVRNDAGRTAKQVQVEGKLGEQTASATLDYVPGRSQESGALLFDAEPGGGTVELRVTGYQLP